jgi:transposase-like protein
MLGWIAEATDMAQREAEKLRRELESVTSRQGPCFPRDLKERATRWIVEQRASGATAAELATELGLAAGTVLRWSHDVSAGHTRSRALIPVVVVPDSAAARTVNVVSPSGFRIEGLSIAEAAALLRVLG